MSSFRKIMIILSRKYVDVFSTGMTAQVTLSVMPIGISLNNFNISVLFSTTFNFWFLQSLCKHSKT